MSPPSSERTLLHSGLRRAASYLLWGIVTGLLVHGIDLAVRGGSFSWMGALVSMGVATLYVAIMSGFMKVVGHWMRQHVPLKSRWAVAVHTVTQGLSVLISFILATALLKPLVGAFFSVTWYPLLVIALVAFSAALVGSSFTYMQRFHRRMREAESAAYEAKLQALRAQINPHFLFNAFNSIAALIRTRPDEAETVVEDLADLFRYTLRSSEEDVASLEDEVRAARLYLAVEEARFRDRLDVRMDVPESLGSVRLPSMTLQPLVENAVKHGAGQTQESCTVTVSARREDSSLVLQVTDTGPGFENPDLETVIDEGTGLANVHERLRLFYGDDAKMHVRSQGVELWIPLATDGQPPAPAAKFEME